MTVVRNHLLNVAASQAVLPPRAQRAGGGRSL